MNHQGMPKKAEAQYFSDVLRPGVLRATKLFAACETCEAATKMEHGP